MNQMKGMKFTLINKNNKSYLSDKMGSVGGNKKLKIYGKLSCLSALKWIAKGVYIKNRVFFDSEETAIAAGYRPCALCMTKEYKKWKIGS